MDKILKQLLLPRRENLHPSLSAFGISFVGSRQLLGTPLLPHLFLNRWDDFEGDESASPTK